MNIWLDHLSPFLEVERGCGLIDFVLQISFSGLQQAHELLVYITRIPLLVNTVLMWELYLYCSCHCVYSLTWSNGSIELMQLTSSPHVAKREMDSGRKSGYYGTMLLF